MLRFVIIQIILGTALLTAQELPFHNYTTANGLIQSQVSRIYQDKLGYMWFCTRTGVDRYDGVSFKHFECYEHFVQSIYEDSHGNIWFATRTDGLFYLPVTNPEDSLARNLTEKDGLNSNNIVDLVEDETGRLIVATRTQGLNIINFQNDSIIQIDSLEQDFKYCKRSIYCLFKDRMKRVWCSFTGGVSYFVKNSDGTFTSRSYSAEEGITSYYIFDIVETPDSTIWLATSRGVFYSEPPFEQFQQLNDGSNRILNQDIRSIHIDQQGKLWCGTNGNGIYQGVFDESGNHWKFTNYTHKNGLEVTGFFQFLKIANITCGLGPGGMVPVS